MGKYLDPKADITFKKIFGEHPDLVMSLLNALLPLEDGQRIESVDYLPTELVPENPGKKNSIVDVRCKDNQGRLFIVEMQLNWNNEFRQRVILNASKAVVKQLDKGEGFHLIQPVYALNLINDVGFDADPDEFYHDYAIVNVAHSDRIIEGLRFVFVELPKFKLQTIAEKKMMVLWLRFLTEINKATVEVPQELLENPETNKALSILEVSAYDDLQLYAYDKFWDAVFVEQSFIRQGEKKGFVKGMEEGFAQGKEEGFAQGKEEGFTQGKEEGFTQGKEEGFVQGKEEGFVQGKEEGFAQGKEEGFTQGKEEGFAQGEVIGFEKLRQRIIDNMRSDGLSDDQIKKWIGQ